MAKVKVPASTYRLQLHKGFSFDDAAGIARYLYDLGISHVYSSPYLQAAPGSMHGYDVVDHQHVNEELGGIAAHQRFSQALGENGLGQVLDIVPNHMAIGIPETASGPAKVQIQNRLFWDVLENGAASRYASFFDIDWNPQEERLRDKVLVPILGDQYGRVLEAGGIKVVRAGSQFLVEAAGQTLPVAPTSLPAILAKAAVYAHSDTLSFLAASYGLLPTPAFSVSGVEDRRMVLSRHRDKVAINGLLSRACADDHGVCDAIDRAVAEVNADHDALDDLLNRQNYRLAYWKTADQQLGYRRFFDVNSLIGLRMERAHVFEETHAVVLEWLRRGVLDGVRVDHPDGLRDPLGYFKRLREAAPKAWIIGEKILAAGEYLRAEWPIDGTSGYDFMNVALGLLARPEGLAELRTVYGEFTGQPTDFPAIAHEKKIAVAQEALGSDVNRLANIFVDICESHRDQRDFTRAEIRRAIRELAACCAIYRTYVVPQEGSRANEITDEDKRVIATMVQCAKDERPDIDAGLFDFFEQVLTLKVNGRLETEFVLRFQQFTSPVMAKGVEDTAFYCFNRLTALCEVGGDPGRDGLTLDEFHQYQQTMQTTHPATMTTLSTHDTKRADDVRARLLVLSEIPHEFADAIARWSKLTARHRTKELPDRNSEYFLYQTLIGAWPIDADRIKSYMHKAMREAKQQTSWVANNKAFEDALNAFIDGILGDKDFLKELESMVGRVLMPGRINSLAQTLVKHTAPGVPDLYQGAELWDLSLVDPDNRRPVDYELRRKLLGELKGMGPARILERMDDGLPKLHVIHSALCLRREHPQWFGAEAAYAPRKAQGAKAQHAVAYLRGDHVLTLAPRHPLTLNGNWGETTLPVPAGVWRNRLTGESIEIRGRDKTTPVAELLREFPVALLTKEETAHA
jgi:(1->4)-alpha-D-glucan 1-alpha-D-glucosylmutase